MRINPKPTKRQLTLAQIAFAALSLLLESATLTVNAQPFSMPEEQINYTITQKDGAMWAKIDGKYPITYTGNETIIPMIYPTPPGTTNISVWMNDTKVSWSNFAEANPEALHHTAIGDWSEILTVLENVTDGFVLRIHYEHPLQVINGSYAFLYDLNIQEYLSAMSNLSVAHFTIAMEVNYTDLKVNTVDPRTETLKPIEYVTRGYENKVIEIDEVSEFGKTLPGDLLFSFSAAETSDDNTLPVVTAAFAAGLIVVGILGYVFVQRRRKKATASTSLVASRTVMLSSVKGQHDFPKKSNSARLACQESLTKV